MDSSVLGFKESTCSSVPVYKDSLHIRYLIRYTGSQRSFSKIKHQLLLSLGFRVCLHIWLPALKCFCSVYLELTDFFCLFPSLKCPCFLVFWFHYCVFYCCCFPISPYCKSGDESQWGRVSPLKNLQVAIKYMTGILWYSLPTCPEKAALPLSV